MIPIGCSGWNYASWRHSFYSQGLPASRWLEHSARVFETGEVFAPRNALKLRMLVDRRVT